MNQRVALYTFGQFSKPADDAVNDGFHLRNDPILEIVEKAPGFLARSGYARACLAFIDSLCQLFFGQDQVGSRSAYLKVRASETTVIVAKKQLARRVRDQWPPAASDVSTDARASLFTAFLADRLTGSRTEWFNESKTCSSDPGPEPWGEEVYPRFYKERGDEWSPASLSLWSDLESPMAFSYFGLHAEALSHGREWFQKPQWPPYVLWWVDGSRLPQWSDAVVRHEHLHDNGSTAFAFDFKHPFDASGQPKKIDRGRIKAIAGLQVKQG